VGKDEDALLRL
jgi:predicted phage-related endonuclease